MDGPTVSEGTYDRIIVSTPSRRVSRWLRRDLPNRVAALGVPVEVVVAGERRQADPDTSLLRFG